MRQKFEIEIPDGGHLAKSRNEEGTYRGTILDDETNQIKGQATLIPVDDGDDAPSDENPDPDLDSEMDPEDAVIGGLLVAIGVGAGFVAGKAADHWGDIKDFFRRKFHKPSKDIDAESTNSEVLEDTSSTELSVDHEQAHDSDNASRIKMTNEEHKQHLRRYILSLILAEAEKCRLENADITNDVPDNVARLDFNALRKKVDTILEENPALLKQPMLDRISSLLSEEEFTDIDIQRVLDKASRSGEKSVIDEPDEQIA